MVVSGAKKRDYGDEKADGEAEAEGGVRIRTQEEREELERDAFKRLEGKVEEREKVKGDKGRIEELYRDNERRWEDPYEVGKRLRRGFRVERKEREKVGKGNEALREKMSLGCEVLAENEEDRVRARGIEFQGGREKDATDEEAIKSRALFAVAQTDVQKPKEARNGKKRKKKMTDEEMALANKEKLRSTLGANTRATIDPFLNDLSGTREAPVELKTFASIKRKRVTSRGADTKGENGKNEENTADSPTATSGAPIAALVDYDSD